MKNFLSGILRKESKAWRDLKAVSPRETGKWTSQIIAEQNSFKLWKSCIFLQEYFFTSRNKKTKKLREIYERD